MLEMLLPEYIKQLLENYQNIYVQLASQLRWLYFDDASRLVTRVSYLDDGYIRLRLDGHWEFTGELLREMSWLYYSVAEVSRNVDMLKNALESVGLDRLRVVAEVTLGEINLTRVGGTPLTARDWSLDFAKLQNLDVALSTRASEVTLSGIKAQIDKLSFDAANRLAIQNPPNLDVALSVIRDRLPSSLTTAGNFRIALLEDAVGLAKENTLSALSGKFAPAAPLSDVMGNPSTTVVGAALLGFDGTLWRRVAIDTSRRLRVVAESVANPPNLDVALSSRASEETLSAIKSKTDNIDVELSTRASESTLSAIAGALDSRATDKLRVSIVDALPESPFNLVKVGDKALTGRDWSADFAKLQNIDVALSTRASESTLLAIRDRLPSSLTTAGNLKVAVSEDAVGLAKEATLSAIKNALASVGTDKLRASVVDALPESPFNLAKVAGTALTGRDWSSDFAKLQNIDVLLSSRASEATLSGIKSQTDKLTFDASSYLQVNVKATVNPPNLDTALSSFVGTPGTGPPGKGVVLLGYDGTYLRLIRTTTDGKLLAQLG